MLNLLKIAAGERLVLLDARQGVVVENVGDGQWLEVAILGDDGAPLPDEPELVHSQDIRDVAGGGA